MIWAILPIPVREQYPQDTVLRVTVRTSKDGESYTLFLNSGSKVTVRCIGGVWQEVKRIAGEPAPPAPPPPPPAYVVRSGERYMQVLAGDDGFDWVELDDATRFTTEEEAERVALTHTVFFAVVPTPEE